MSGASESDGPRPRPGITAVVVAYDAVRELPACLDALLGGARKPDEVIVVDNGSTDGTQALVRERYPDAQLLELPHNPGPAGARNLGMRAARFERVLTIDDDVVVAPGTLAALDAALDADPSLAAVQSRSLVAHDRSTIHYDGGEAHFAGLIALRHFFEPLGSATPTVARVGSFVSLCVLQDNARVLEVGGYDETLEILFEDSDLSFRLRARGHGIAVVEEAPCLHGAGTAGTSFRAASYPSRRVFLHARNRWILLLKNHRAGTLFVTSPGLLVYELYWLLFATLRGGLFAYLRGKWAFVQLLPTTLRARRVVQRTRVVGDRDLLVGGPLTLSPQLREKPLQRALASSLDAVLRGWWALARPLVR